MFILQTPVYRTRKSSSSIPLRNRSDPSPNSSLTRLRSALSPHHATASPRCCRGGTRRRRGTRASPPAAGDVITAPTQEYRPALNSCSDIVVFVLLFRFFSSSSSETSLTNQGAEPVAVDPSKDTSSLSLQTLDSDGPDAPSVVTPSPPLSSSSSPPCSASQGLKLFQWSGGAASTERSRTTSASGLGVLQRFQYKKESGSSQKVHGLFEGSTPTQSPSPVKNLEGDLSDSPPSQDSAYFSQSQSRRMSFHKEDVVSVGAEDAPSVRSQNTDVLLKLL